MWFTFLMGFFIPNPTARLAHLTGIVQKILQGMLEVFNKNITFN
jgi:hypothetical protein